MTPRRALAFSLAAFAFLAPLSIAGLNAGLAAVSAALLWCLASPADAPRVRAALRDAARSPAFWALAALALWEPISGLGGLDPAGSLRLWPKDLHKLWAYLALWAAVAAADGAAPGAALGAGFGLHALVGVGQGVVEWVRGWLSVHAAGADRKMMFTVRAHGFVHPVTYGEILGLGLIAASAFLTRGPKERRRPAALLAAVLGAALLLNETRAALGALAVAWIAAAAADARWRRRARAGLLAGVAVIALWEVMPTGGRNLRTMLDFSPRTSQHRSRFVLWGVAARAGAEHPAFGVGSGQYHRAFEAMHPEPLDGQGSWSNAHNLFLHQFAERGAPGLLLLLIAFWIFGRGAWRASKRGDGAWALAAWAAVPAFIVMNLTETAFQTEQVATLFLFLWILGAGPAPAAEIL